MTATLFRILLELAESFAELGAKALHAMTAGVPRRWIEWITLVRDRRRARRKLRCQLQWTRPGATWAMDHTYVGAQIGGTSKYLFALRDLASGMPLAARPTRSTDAADVHAELRRLFAAHGPPLVLKSDNGSGLCAPTIDELCKRNGVELLRSPPRTPRYNGSIEAGIGSLKRAAGRIAERSGRSGAWTSDDLEGALQLLARTGRPRRASVAPIDSWRGRRPIDDAERAAFQDAAERHRRQLAQDLAPESLGRATVERAALRRALQDLQYLMIRRTGDSTGE